MKKVMITAALLTAMGVYAQTGSISGSVIDEVSLLPINGAKILAVYDSAGITIDQGEDLTDITGHYEITGLNPGLYVLSIEAADYYPVDFPELVDHDSGENISDVDFEMISYQDSLGITGSVRLIDFYGGDWTGNTWVVSEKGYVLKPSQLTPIDSLGIPTGLAEYFIENLPLTNCCFWACVPGYMPQYYNHVYSAEQAYYSYPPQTEIDFDLERAVDSTLTGGVSGVISGKFGPLPYSSVYARKDGQLYSGCVTDTNGKYRLALEPGVYRVYATRPGYKSKYYALDVTVADQKVPDIDIELQPGGLNPVIEEQVAQEAEVGSLLFEPNPFVSATTVKYELPTSGNVTVRLYDKSGSLVRTLLETYQSAGKQHISWDGKDALANPLPSGIYFCHITCDRANITRPVIIIR